MSILYKLEDNEYEYQGIKRVRTSSRAFILNDKNEVLLNIIDRHDNLDDYIYYETPGGGVKNTESLIDAFLISSNKLVLTLPISSTPCFYNKIN